MGLERLERESLFETRDWYYYICVLSPMSYALCLMPYAECESLSEARDWYYYMCPEPYALCRMPYAVCRIPSARACPRPGIGTAICVNMLLYMCTTICVLILLGLERLERDSLSESNWYEL